MQYIDQHRNIMRHLPGSSSWIVDIFNIDSMPILAVPPKKTSCMVSPVPTCTREKGYQIESCKDIRSSSLRSWYAIKTCFQRHARKPSIIHSDNSSTSTQFPFHLPRPKSPTRCRPPVLNRNLGLCSVENLQELGHSVSHPRVHVRLGAFDVVVEVVAEQLDSVNGRDGLSGVGKVTREEYCALAVARRNQGTIQAAGQCGKCRRVTYRKSHIPSLHRSSIRADDGSPRVVLGSST